MAKIKSYTDPYGVTHTEAVWYPDLIAIDHSARTARIVFRGWHNLAALAAGARPLAGAEKVHEVSGSTYLTLAASSGPANTALLSLIAEAAYTHAASVHDTPDPTDSTWQAENRNQRHVAFFAGCADIDL